MKFSIALLSLLIFVQPVFAHLIGQPPFLKINNQYANLYPVPLTSLNNFDLPQDLTPDNYLVSPPISFELDKNKLPAPPEVVAKTKFDWDFADGAHAQGLSANHTYNHIGSYIIKIYADDGTTPKPQLIESALINILPDKNYQLPQAKITVNGQQSQDPLTDILKFNFQDQLNFECGEKDCFWDFGDQKSASGPKQTHQYPADLSQVFVVLRVKDSNGFLADSFVEIQNSLNGQDIATNSATPVSSSKKPNQLPFILGILALLAFMVPLFARVLGRGGHQ